MRRHLAQEFLRAVDDHGLILVHDQVLPSITRIASGEPVRGSWWAHPMANDIYNALAAIEDDVLGVRLVLGKETLVARRLWPEIVSIAMARSAWQVDGLDEPSRTLLDRIEQAPAPVVMAAAERDRAKVLARRLLVQVDDVHTPEGHHVSVYGSWERWAAERRIKRLDPDEARRRITAIVAGWSATGRRRLLPW